MAIELKNNIWQISEGGRAWPLIDFAKGQASAFYVYDLGDARERARAFLKSGASVHFAMKANSHPRLLALLAEEGLGADVVSLGEMQKAIRSGFKPERIIFSGVGKGRDELSSACKLGLKQVNVESFEELQLLRQVAQDLDIRARFALRVNIHLAAPTHKNIQTATEESKFGLDVRQLPEVLQWVKGESGLEFMGLAVHVGSQIMDVSVFSDVNRKMAELVTVVRGHGLEIKTLDFGGGLGIDYTQTGQNDFDRLPEYFNAIMSSRDQGVEIVLEPGRFLVARMGVLCARVVHIKQGVNRRFCILNAGMNALMRPALYQAYHRIELISRPAERARENYSVVGPLCESTDVFADSRSLPPLEAGDWLGVFDAGAYGAVMANRYNEMPLPAEYSVLDGRVEVL